jgi:hypothetical protein
MGTQRAFQSARSWEVQAMCTQSWGMLNEPAHGRNAYCKALVILVRWAIILSVRPAARTQRVDPGTGPRGPDMDGHVKDHGLA